MSETPALSAHVAHVLCTESALHAFTYHRLLGGQPKPTTDAQAKGTLLHYLLLEARSTSGGGKLVVIHADDYRSNAAKAARDHALANGMIPVLRPKLAEAAEIVEGWKAQLAPMRVNGEPLNFESGQVEVPIEWHERGFGDRKILCRGRLDWYRPGLVIDFKSLDGSVHPDTCARRLIDSPAVIQDHVYRRGVGMTEPALAGRVECIFMYGQTVPPYAVVPIKLGESMREIGRRRWERALELWDLCMSTNTWPGYGTSPITVEAPVWAVQRELEDTF